MFYEINKNNGRRFVLDKEMSTNIALIKEMDVFNC